MKHGENFTNNSFFFHLIDCQLPEYQRGMLKLYNINKSSCDRPDLNAWYYASLHLPIE